MRIVWLFNIHYKSQNIGDVAIVLMIRKWIKDHFPTIEVCEYTIKDMVSGKRPVFREDDIILFHEHCVGRPYHLKPLQKVREKVLRELGSRRVIHLPATVYLPNDFEETKYWSGNKLFMARDAQSYTYASENFSCDVELIPDFAYYYKPEWVERTVDKACLVLRGGTPNDSQKNMDKEGCVKVKSVVDSVIESDLIDLNAYYDNCDAPIKHLGEQLSKILKTYQTYRLIITDRFHGVVFSALAGVPCVALSYGCVIPHKLNQEVFFPHICVDKPEELREGVIRALELEVSPLRLDDYFDNAKRLILS